MTRPLTALVTDGDERPALAITRALGRRGISVVVGADRMPSLASTSKYAVRAVTYPSPYRDAAAFDRFLLELVDLERIDLVLPVSDPTTHAVCRLQKQLERICSVAVPTFEAFEQVTNKQTLLEHAVRVGLRIPRTVVVSSRAQLDRVRPLIGYPAVVKPVQSKVPTDNGWTAAGVQYAKSENELLRLFDAGADRGHLSWLIQERIVGPGVGVFALFDRGEIVAHFAHRRIREKPPSGGVSVLCESIALPSQLRTEFMRLLGPLGWHGVAMVEYKQDAETGQFVLMEVNGRFWGSLQLAVDAGVDFPFLLCELAQGRRPASQPAYRVGVRSRWLLGDLDHLLIRLFARDDALHLLPDAPSRAGALAAFLTPAGVDVRHEVNRSDDLRPFWHEARRFGSTLLRSARSRVRPVVRNRAGGAMPLAALNPK